MKSGQFSLRSLFLIVTIVGGLMAGWTWFKQLRRDFLRQDYRKLLVEIELNPTITPDLADEARELLGEDEYRELNAERQRRFVSRAQ
jgi:hypothetical protein